MFVPKVYLVASPMPPTPCLLLFSVCLKTCTKPVQGHVLEPLTVNGDSKHFGLIEEPMVMWGAKASIQTLEEFESSKCLTVAGCA